MISSMIVVSLFAALITWTIATGMRHWGNPDERRKRIHELTGEHIDAIDDALLEQFRSAGDGYRLEHWKPSSRAS